MQALKEDLQKIGVSWSKPPKGIEQDMKVHAEGAANPFIELKYASL